MSTNLKKCFANLWCVWEISHKHKLLKIMFALFYINRIQRTEISHKHLKPTPCFPLTFVRSPTGDQRMPSCGTAWGLKADLLLWLFATLCDKFIHQFLSCWLSCVLLTQEVIFSQTENGITSRRCCCLESLLLCCPLETCLGHKDHSHKNSLVLGAPLCCGISWVPADFTSVFEWVLLRLRY